MKGFSPFSSLFFSDDNYVSLRENKPTDNQHFITFMLNLMRVELLKFPTANKLSKKDELNHGDYGQSLLMT